MTQPLYFVRKEKLHGFPVWLVIYRAKDGDEVVLDFFKTARGARSTSNRLNGKRNDTAPLL